MHSYQYLIVVFYVDGSNSKKKRHTLEYDEMHGSEGLVGSIAQLVHQSNLLAELSPASWRNSWSKPASADEVSESMVRCQPSAQQLTKQSQLMVHLTVHVLRYLYCKYPSK